jgi:hypothetical protein
MDDVLPFTNHPVPLWMRALNPIQSADGPYDNDGKLDPSIMRNTSAVATIYVALFPKATQRRNADCEASYPQSTMLQCTMYNSSRSLEFTYIDGRQHISSNNVTIFANEPILAVGGVYGPKSTSHNASGYSLRSKCATLNTSGDPCVFNTTIAQNLAYQALMESFGDLLVGSIRWQNRTNSQGDNSTTPMASSRSRYSRSTNTATMSHVATGSPAKSSQMFSNGSTKYFDSGAGVGVIYDTTIFVDALFRHPAFSFLRLWSTKSEATTDLRQRLDHLAPFALDENPLNDDSSDTL